MPKLAVLVSGTGSILEAILQYPLDVELVIADRDCPAVAVALNAGVRVKVVNRSRYYPFSKETRHNFSGEVLHFLHKHGSGDVAAMAGFGTILDPMFFSSYKGILLNTHPSLLPAFKGHNAVQKALDARATESGCTIHVATPALDDGPVLAQEKVPVLPNDTEETLHERIKSVERVLYPRIIKEVLQKTL